MKFSDFTKSFLVKPVVEYPNNRAETPIVTVRVLVYNHVDYLSTCLDSILKQQTKFDFEILLAEDDSNDGSRELCIEYAKKFPDKIRLLLNSRKNNIQINGKETGLFNSVYSNYQIKSKYIALCEADDYWVDSYSLQKRVDFLENNLDHVLCFHNSKKQIQDTIEKSNTINLKKSISISKEELIDTTIPTASLMYRNNIIGKFDIDMIGVPNGDSILRGKLAMHGKGRYIHEIEPSIYRVHNGGNFRSLLESQKIDTVILSKKYLLKKFPDEEWLQKHIKASISNLKMIQLKFELGSGNFKFNLLKESYSYKTVNSIIWAKRLVFFLIKHTLYKFNRG